MRAIRNSAPGLIALLSLAWAVTRAVAAGPDAGPYRPHIDPADFQATVDHPYFPLVPGTTFKYVEKAGRRTLENLITVTHDSKTIMGVRCVVVHDRVTEKGGLREDTFDWYAQDKRGNVWYFGEATREFLPRGRVSTAGSWEAGVAGAQPGIIMPGRPMPGEPYRQEYRRGHAEDMGQIVAVGDSATAPYGSFADCVRTKDWSLLESGHEHKWYARGIGLVREESSQGEVATLVSITRP